MSEREGTDHIRRLFADQFEPDGDGYIYRKHSSGAPIRVSAAERDHFVAAFSKFAKYWFWGIVAGILFFATAAAFFVPEFDSTSFAWIIAGLVLAISMAIYFWAWNFPVRELRGRGTVGAARSRAEMQRRYLEKFTYGDLVLPLGAAAVLLFKVGSKGNLFAGWNRLWLALAVLILAGTIVQAFRKWRFDSRRKFAGDPPAAG